LEVGGFDRAELRGRNMGDEEMLGCDVGAIKSGAHGQLGLRLFCQDRHRLEWRYRICVHPPMGMPPTRIRNSLVCPATNCGAPCRF
jgi:hypothetical protein